MNELGKKNTLPYFYAGILILILIGAFSFSFIENQKGVLNINTNDKNIQIIIDQKDLGKLTSDNLKLQKGEHSIILSKENFWPWTTKINIQKQKTIEIEPFFVPKETSGFIIQPNDKEYEKIISLFNTNTRIDWEKNNNTPEIIKNLKTEIRNSDFYKNREDVIVIAVQNGIYALEINTSSIPNFQPIYKGSNPTFVKKNNDSLYIKDNNILMEVNY